MLFELGQILRLTGASISHVVHVGAHRGEEVPQYLKYGAKKIVLIEQDLALVSYLREKFQDRVEVSVIEATVGSGRNAKLWSASNFASSSIYKPELHLVEHPDVKFSDPKPRRTTRLQDLLPYESRIDLINLDIQGAELEALTSLGSKLEQVRLVYTEINRKSLYGAMPLVGEVDNYMKSVGFIRSATAWTKHGWGDALYLNQRFFKSRTLPKVRLYSLLNSLSPKTMSFLFQFIGATRQQFQKLTFTQSEKENFPYP